LAFIFVRSLARDGCEPLGRDLSRRPAQAPRADAPAAGPCSAAAIAEAAKLAKPTLETHASGGPRIDLATLA
jgi:hypothetical protein